LEYLQKEKVAQILYVHPLPDKGSELESQFIEMNLRNNPADNGKLLEPAKQRQAPRDYNISLVEGAKRIYERASSLTNVFQFMKTTAQKANKPFPENYFDKFYKLIIKVASNQGDQFKQTTLERKWGK